MTFLDDELSVITRPNERRLSIDEVIEQGLILFVSVNVKKNPDPVMDLAKMMLQNLQLMVEKRYENEEQRCHSDRPLFSVVLDEFAPFSYRNFPQILQTARGTNTAFLFSMQSLPQLIQVERGFKEDVTSAPNTTLTLRSRDEETARYFLRVSAEHTVTKRSVTTERFRLFGYEKYEKTTCGVQMFDPIRRRPVAVLTQFPWSHATTITNMMPILAAEVAQRYLTKELHDSEYIPSFDLVEHYYPRGDGTREELFHLVTLQTIDRRPARRGFIDRLTGQGSGDPVSRETVLVARDGDGRLTVGKVSWKQVSRQDVDSLIGETYRDSFRAHITSGTADAMVAGLVGLLRKRLLPLTEFDGPLLAINVDERYVEPAFGYGSLYLLMDGCWLYMTADRRGGDGVLSDKQVAERFFIGDLVIQLLRSARSGIDGCLEQMSAQKDRANFAGDLGA
jgi:hypothetical protein